MNMPYVAVIGGLWAMSSDQAAAAKQAAQAIGAALAEAGFGLVVYFSDEMSLEPHVVAGYVGSGKLTPSCIRVRYAESQRDQIKFAEETIHAASFEHRQFPGADWEAPFYFSLAEEDGVDALLLLGGGKSTLTAGLIAIARRVPVLPIDGFGGAAAKIWSHLAQASRDRHLPAWQGENAASLVERLKADCASAAERRRRSAQGAQRIARLDSQRATITVAGLAFLALLALAAFGIVIAPQPALYPLVVLGGLVAAGATGATVRPILAGRASAQPFASLLLGGLAGFAVGLAYLIPQWVGAAHVLEAKGVAVSATDKIQFASAILVAISAGVGFDTVFRRIEARAADAPIGPPG
jgi:hypothetical protein